MKGGVEINKMADYLFRENSGKMVAVLAHLFGLHRIDDILDAVQDTFEAAMSQWKFSGVPQNPSAWLMQVAKNKAINKLKRDGKTSLLEPSSFLKSFDRAEDRLSEYIFSDDEIEDSQLQMLLTTCHPDFSERNQVILTLHFLSGFGISEISNALLMKADAVKKALVRCKAELKNRHDVFHAVNLRSLQDRIDMVHSILYLVFNEGYKTTRSKDLTNTDLCYEAMRLCKLLLKPGVSGQNESSALLALMFFNLSRFPSRLNSEGEIVTLEHQDRSKWNKVFIEEGYYYLNLATRDDTLNKFVIESIIASIHCTAKTFADTDWKTILYLYKELEKISPSPMVTLNKIVAASFLENRTELLQELDKLKESALQNHFLLYAAEGDMLKRNGRTNEAKDAFEQAYRFASSPLDKSFLKSRISQC